MYTPAYRASSCFRILKLLHLHGVVSTNLYGVSFWSHIEVLFKETSQRVHPAMEASDMRCTTQSNCDWHGCTS